MKTHIIKITSLIVLFLNLNVFAQNTEAPTLSAGLDNIAFNPGTLNVELITEIIKEKQKELIAEGVKRFLVDNIIKADDFYTQFYLERIISILFEEKNHQVMTKKILEETTNYLFIIGTTEFVMNTKGKEVFDFLLTSKDSINLNEKQSIKDIDNSHNNKDRLIYFIYYICKDNKIIKDLGMLNNFNYFELNHKSDNTEFEEVRNLIDNIFKIVDYTKKSESLNGFFKNLDKDKYDVFKKTLKTFGINISEGINNNIIKYLNSKNEKINEYNIVKQVLSIFGINIENTNLDKDIKELYNEFEKNKTEINTKINILIKSITILNNYAKGDDLINNFNLEEYKALKSIIKSFKIKLLNEKEDEILKEFLKNPKENREKISEELININKKIINKFIEISKINTSDTYVKIKNILAIIHFIEELLNNHDTLKDIINIAGISKDNLTDKINKKYEKQVDEYDSNNILDFTNQGKDFSIHFNYLVRKIDDFNDKINAYNILDNGLNSWKTFSKNLNENIIETKNWINVKNKINVALQVKVVFDNTSNLKPELENLKLVVANDTIFSNLENLIENLNEKNADFNRIDKITSNKKLNKLIDTVFILYESYLNLNNFNFSKNSITNELLLEINQSLKNLPKINTSIVDSENKIILITLSSKNNINQSIKNIKNASLEKENKEKIIAQLTKYQNFYKLIENSTFSNQLMNVNTITEEKLQQIDFKNRLQQLYNDNKEVLVKNYADFNTFYTNNKDEVIFQNTLKTIKTKINSLKTTIDPLINIEEIKNPTALFSKIIKNYKDLKDKIKVHFFGKNIANIFKLIRKNLKGITINYKNLKEEDIATLKKFNRIILRRNLLDNINGLELVKELNDELMSDLYFIKSSMDSVQAKKFEKILNTVEFAISNMIKDQVNKEKPFFKDIEANLVKYLDFIKFIANIKELNKAETFSYLLKTMSNYKELFNIEDDNSLVDIVNSIRTYSIINNKKNVIEIDAASVLVHFTEKYKNHKYVPYNGKSKTKKFFNFLRNNTHFYATVGVNQSTIPNYDKTDTDFEGITSKSFSSASEKLGVKIDLWDFTRDNYKKTEMMHQMKRKPLVSNIYVMGYASGILYKIANTSDNGFESASVGTAIGLSFFNSLDFNFNIAVPLKGDAFKNYFIGFSFDIPLSEYLSRL